MYSKLCFLTFVTFTNVFMHVSQLFCFFAKCITGAFLTSIAESCPQSEYIDCLLTCIHFFMEDQSIYVLILSPGDNPSTASSYQKASTSA